MSRSVCLRSQSFFRVTHIQRGLTLFIAYISEMLVQYFITAILFLDVRYLFDIYFSAVLYSEDIAVEVI